MPRLPLLPLEEMPEKTRNMITGGKSELSAKNINKMVAHAENSAAISCAWVIPYSPKKLDARLRELAILRIAALCDSHYEWYPGIGRTNPGHWVF